MQLDLMLTGALRELAGNGLRAQRDMEATGESVTTSRKRDSGGWSGSGNILRKSHGTC